MDKKETLQRPHQKAWHVLELASAVASRVLGVICILQVAIPLRSTPVDDSLLLMAGLALIGLPGALKLFADRT